MWSELTSRTLSAALQPWLRRRQQQQQLGITLLNRAFCSASSSMVEVPHDNSIYVHSNRSSKTEMLSLEEAEKILSDVKADDVKVIPIPRHYDFTDFMIIATGRSAWHVRNIAQALIYQVKQKQRGVKRMLLPSVEGQEGGKWIVIDAGALVIHALDEKVRGYYNLEKLWTSGTSNNEHSQEMDNAFKKIRRKNNSKKPIQTGA